MTNRHDDRVLCSGENLEPTFFLTDDIGAYYLRGAMAMSGSGTRYTFYFIDLAICMRTKVGGAVGPMACLAMIRCPIPLQSKF